MPKCEFHDEIMNDIRERLERLEKKIDNLNNRWTDKVLAFLAGILGVLAGWLMKTKGM